MNRGKYILVSERYLGCGKSLRGVPIRITLLNPSPAYLALLTTPRTLCMMLVFRPRPELGGAEK